jgi:hypothetical protein
MSKDSQQVLNVWQNLTLWKKIIERDKTNKTVKGLEAKT